MEKLFHESDLEQHTKLQGKFFIDLNQTEMINFFDKKHMKL